MPRLTDISSLLALASLGVTAAAFGAPLAAQPAGEGSWALSCRAGTDGFASNCTARLASGRVTFQVRTADSQVFAAIRHPRCRTNYRNFDRTDLAALPRGRRYAAIARAFSEIRAEARRTCRSVRLPALSLGGMPDITIHPNRSEP